MMSSFVKAAVKIQQGPLLLYATSFTVADLMEENFYRIDKLDPEDPGSGYQRLLDSRRTKRIATYFKKAWQDKDAFLPTSILLATDRPIAYQSDKHTISFNLKEIGPFNVVDGQHRIEGLIAAAKQNKEIREFQVAANIAVNIDEISQMCHFLIVNTTQRSVDKAVEQQIFSRLTDMVNFKTVPTLPRWIKRQVDSGEDQQALMIAEYLNREKSSPWYQKIEMANQSSGLDQITIRQKSFVQSIKKYILSSNNPLMHSDDYLMRNKILMNYWLAVSNLLVKPGDKTSVIYKTNGLNLFHMISPIVFAQTFTQRDFRVDVIQHLLSSAFEKLDDEFVAMTSPDWWMRGAGASSLNSIAIRRHAAALNQAIVSLDESESLRV